MRVGVAGLGKMGAAIAARLMECGHDVIVWNRSADKTKPLADAGATVATSPADLAAQAEAILTILTDAAAIDAVYHGASGSSVGRRQGQAVHRDEHGRSPRPKSRWRTRCAARVRPLSNVRSAAPPGRRGRASCSALPAASEADVARAKPLLDQMCRRVEHVGDVGAGAGHQARDQSAADDLLAGAGRGACHQPPPECRSGADDGHHRRYVRRLDRGEEPGPEYCGLACGR